jgi:hypothetical protein
MAAREWFGFALVTVGVILAPVAIIRGGMWWVVVVAGIVAGIVTFLSRRVVDEEKRSGDQLADDSGGLGLGAHRPTGVGGAAARSEMSDGDTSDVDSD